MVAKKPAKRATDKQPESSESKRGNPANLKPWPKGVSGNWAGRPKGVRYLSEAYRAWLSQPSEQDPERTNADVLAASEIGPCTNAGRRSIRKPASLRELSHQVIIARPPPTSPTDIRDGASGGLAAPAPDASPTVTMTHPE